jgi:hypothetical protein
MTLELTASRVVDGDVDRTFSLVLPMPLEQLFVRWYGPLPPIRSTDGPLPWQTPGQQRRVDLVGPGSMSETLTEVEPPHHFSYRLDDIHGPMKGLIAAVDGRWAFAPHGAGTEITWSWSVTPRPATRWLLPVFGRFWQGYADRALQQLDALLVSGRAGSGTG